MKEAETNGQHKGIISALRAAAPKWKFIPIHFVAGNCGSVVESDFTPSDVQEGKQDKLFAGHVTQVCEAYNRVIVSFLQQIQEFARRCHFDLDLTESVKGK